FARHRGRRFDERGLGRSDAALRVTERSHAKSQTWRDRPRAAPKSPDESCRLPGPPQCGVPDRQGSSDESRRVRVSRPPEEEERLSRAVDRADQRRRARARHELQRVHERIEEGGNRDRPQGSGRPRRARQGSVYEDRGAGQSLARLIQSKRQEGRDTPLLLALKKAPFAGLFSWAPRLSLELAYQG